MSTTSNPKTKQAGIIATFYGRRDEMLALQQAVGMALNLVKAHSDFVDMSDPDRKRFLRRFDPVLAHDTTVVQLALSESDPNLPDDAPTVWQKMRGELEGGELGRILDEAAAQRNQKGQSIFWGYTLIYHATLADGVTLDQGTEKELFGLAYRPHSSPWARPEPLAQSKIEGSQLWLLDIPNRGEGAEAATVYVALAPLARENDLITKVLYGQGAALLMPDLIAHKGYNQRRQYVGRQADQSPRKLYKKRIDELQQTIGPFLGFHLPPSPNGDASQQPKNLNPLKFRYAQLLFATSILDKPRLSIAQQVENYAWWLDKLGEGDLATYHQKQIDVAYRELELLIDQGQRMLQAAHTTISIEQTELDQRREGRENLLAAILAILGVAFTVSQVVDESAAVALRDLLQYEFGFLSSLPEQSSARLLGLQAQVPLQCLITFLLTGVVYWLYRRSRH